MISKLNALQESSYHTIQSCACICQAHSIVQKVPLLLLLVFAAVVLVTCLSTSNISTSSTRVLVSICMPPQARQAIVICFVVMPGLRSERDLYVMCL